MQFHSEQSWLKKTDDFPEEEKKTEKKNKKSFDRPKNHGSTYQDFLPTVVVPAAWLLSYFCLHFDEVRKIFLIASRYPSISQDSKFGS